MTKPIALTYFEKELAYIQDSSIQAFFYNALAEAPTSFHEDEALLKQTKKAYHILRGILEAKGVQGAVKDALLGTTLLCDILHHEYTGDLHMLHTVAVRPYLAARRVNEDVHQGLWENMMRAVEAHHGDKSISPLLEAKPGTAENEVYTAFLLANLPYLTVNTSELI